MNTCEALSTCLADRQRLASFVLMYALSLNPNGQISSAASGNIQLWEEGRGAVGCLLCVAEGLAPDVGQQASLEAWSGAQGEESAHGV